MLDLEASIAGCAQAHRRLRHNLGRLDDELARKPSRLPGWTIGHVVTHLARNADSHTRMLDGALAGEHLEQYAGGGEQRAADIEAGAGRDSGTLVDDLVTAFVGLEQAWDRMTPAAWDGWGLSGGHPCPCRHLPFYRWREVEVHHVDLGLGYQVTDWPDEYLAVELPFTLSSVTERIADHGTRANLLGWLLGRTGPPAAIELAPWPGRRPEDAGVADWLLPPAGSAL